LSEEFKKRLDEKIRTYQDGLLMYGTTEYCHDSSDVHIDVCHSNKSESCTHSKLVMGTQDSSQVLRHIIASVSKNLLSQNAPKHLSALFDYMDVKNVPRNLQSTIAQQPLKGVSIALWSIVISDIGLALFVYLNIFLVLRNVSKFLQQVTCGFISVSVSWILGL
jgi:hypothetical protein